MAVSSLLLSSSSAAAKFDGFNLTFHIGGPCGTCLVGYPAGGAESLCMQWRKDTMPPSEMMEPQQGVSSVRSERGQE